MVATGGLDSHLIREVIAAARGLGFDLPNSLVELQIERTRTMGAYRASTLIDFEKGQPIELESLFLEPLRQAKKPACRRSPAGIDGPGAQPAGHARSGADRWRRLPASVTYEPAVNSLILRFSSQTILLVCRAGPWLRSRAKY